MPGYVSLVYPIVAACSSCGDRKGAASIPVVWLWNARLCSACEKLLCAVFAVGPLLLMHSAS